MPRSETHLLFQAALYTDQASALSASWHSPSLSLAAAARPLPRSSFFAPPRRRSLWACTSNAWSSLRLHSRHASTALRGTSSPPAGAQGVRSASAPRAASTASPPFPFAGRLLSPIPRPAPGPWPPPPPPWQSSRRELSSW